MPTSTYVPLATITLTSTDSEIVFSSIPATYRDLIVVFNGTASDAQDMNFKFNSDTSASYSRVFMYAQSSGFDSASASGETGGFFAAPQTVRSTVVAQIMDYSATDKHKTVLTRSDNAGDRVRAYAGRWAKTEAINTVAIAITGGATYSIGSTFSLYGIAA